MQPAMCLGALQPEQRVYARAHCDAYPGLGGCEHGCLSDAHAGDEYAQTRGGNNNWYGHDTKMTRFDWDALEAQRSNFFRFYRRVWDSSAKLGRAACAQHAQLLPGLHP